MRVELHRGIRYNIYIYNYDICIMFDMAKRSTLVYMKWPLSDGQGSRSVLRSQHSKQHAALNTLFERCKGQ